MTKDNKLDANGEGQKISSAPSISLPKGGGAIRGIGEKFAANPVNGTGSMSVPNAASPSRSGFGWSLSLPSITRKTDKVLPRYDDANESDVFILSGAEDLVPVLKPDGNRLRMTLQRRVIRSTVIRPRIEGSSRASSAGPIRLIPRRLSGGRFPKTTSLPCMAKPTRAASSTPEIPKVDGFVILVHGSILEHSSESEAEA